LTFPDWVCSTHSSTWETVKRMIRALILTLGRGGLVAVDPGGGREIHWRSSQRMMSASFGSGGAEPVLGRPVTLFADAHSFDQWSRAVACAEERACR
jgi:hypothetical protein